MISAVINGLMAVGAVGIFATSLYVRITKKLDVGAYKYGILATILLCLCSLMIIFSDNVAYMVIDGLFLSSMFYNFTNWFAIKKQHIEDSNEKFTSYYIGLIVVGAFIQIFMLGLEGSMLTRLSVNADIIALYGAELFETLLEAYKANILEYYYLLIIETLVGAFVAYFVLRMFAYGARNKVLKTTIKGELLMASFYIVNVFGPHNKQESLILVVVYLAIALATFMMYQNSKNDKPTIEVIIK